MSSYEEPVDISVQSCRVCLETHEITLCLHDQIEYNELNVELWELLEVVSKVKSTWSDPKLPTQLCQNCTRRLVDAYDFIRQVEKSQQMLHDVYHNVQTVGNQEEQQQQDIVYTECVEELELPEVELAKPLVEEDETELHSDPLHSQDVDVSEDDHNQLPDDTDCYMDEAKGWTQLGTRLDRSQGYTYKCESCPRVFAKNESLERHLALAHSVPADVAAMELASKGALTCAHCPRIFKRHDTLRRHMQAFHPQAEAEPAACGIKEPSAMQNKRTAKRRECPHCGVSFPISSLTIHIRRHTGENPYKCDECERAFPRSQDLSMHRRMHTGERPNMCAICGKTFISQSKLARHMRLHTGQRPFSCNQCHKSFVQSNDLKIHMRRHTGERPYKCGICSESFVCGSLLNIHRNNKAHHEPTQGSAGLDVADPYENSRVHKRRAEDIARVQQQRDSEQATTLQRPYKCGVCGERFASGALLTIHRNNKAHYEAGKLYYGDPYEGAKKRQSQQPKVATLEDKLSTLSTQLETQ